jgi:hypothetical protein
MKKALQFLFLCLCLASNVALWAQSDWQKRLVAQRPELAKAFQPRTKGGPLGNNAELRLDSTLRTVLEIPPSFIDERSVYSYSGDSIFIDRYYYDQLGFQTAQGRTILAYRSENYLSYFGVGNVINDVFDPTFEVKIYNNLNNIQKLDSIFIYSKDWLTNIYYRQEGIFFEYDVANTPQLNKEFRYTYDVNGAIILTRLGEFSYSGNQKLDKLDYSYFDQAGNLSYIETNSYVYQQDSTTTTVHLTQNGTTTPEYRYLRVAAPGIPDQNKENSDFEWDEIQQEWALTAQRFYFFDSEKRVEREEDTYYYDNDIVGYKFEYTYVQDEHIDQTIVSSLESATMSWVPYNSTQYYYTEVSSTQQPQTELSTATVVPNPATQQTTITMGKGTIIRAANLLDASGRVVRRYDAVDNNALTLERNGLANGLYLVQIVLDGGTVASAKVVWE